MRMATYAAEGHAVTDASLDTLRDRIESALREEPFHPWCVHRLYEQLAPPGGTTDREHGLMRTQFAADMLASEGRVRRESVSAVTIGVHCQDTLYWSLESECSRLEEFGPDYESPTLLHRLGAHFQCHGL
jgi:hypothetical protein